MTRDAPRDILFHIGVQPPNPETSMQTPIPPGQMTPEARIDFIEAIRSRIAAADALRANGKTAEADALDPDSDELNAAVDIVRLIRASRASAPKRTANAAPVPTLADLLKGGA